MNRGQHSIQRARSNSGFIVWGRQGLLTFVTDARNEMRSRRHAELVVLPSQAELHAPRPVLVVLDCKNLERGERVRPDRPLDHEKRRIGAVRAEGCSIARCTRCNGRKSGPDDAAGHHYDTFGRLCL